MNLKEKIQEKKSEFQSTAPKENQEVMKQAMDELRDSGILDRALGENDRAPDFTVSNSRGEPVNLQETLSSGPVVLGFYRGRW